jgi:hypothetical protein
MGINYERTTVSLDHHSVSALNNLSEQTGLPRSKILRALVIAHAAGKPAPLPKTQVFGPATERMVLIAKLGQVAI